MTEKARGLVWAIVTGGGVGAFLALCLAIGGGL